LRNPSPHPMERQVSACPHGARILIWKNVLPAGSWVVESPARRKTGLPLTEETNARAVAETAAVENNIMG
jgi:hypothetical protein